MKWIKKNYKYIIIGAIIILLLCSGVGNWIQDKWNKNLKVERDSLEQLQADLKISFKNLDEQYLLSQDRITILQARVDSLKEVHVLKTAEIKRKEKLYREEIARIKDIPPDTVYKKTFAYYPVDFGEALKYPFSASQIRGIYKSYIDLDYNLRLNKDLNDEIMGLNFNLALGDEIIENKDIQLGSLKTQIKLNETYTLNLGQLNTNLERSYKSERRSKHLWQGVSAIEFAYIMIQGFKK